MRTAAIYARVSTANGSQTTENQLLELRRYVEARSWTAKEYVDGRVSGAKDRRLALDQLVLDARRRRFDVVVVWSLDRLGRSLKYLVLLLDDLQALGVGFISVREGLDWTTLSGRLQAQLLAMIAEFERARLRERVLAGLVRARAQGKRLGRPWGRPIAATRTSPFVTLPACGACRRPPRHAGWWRARRLGPSRSWSPPRPE